ncbi:PEP-CTERM sorting domain-containing protein [Candidatus Falkowbacteria bacterium]|nr:PEP-CTERM sorting domain-containing protein [Candidatus Falkowbacteria bacterium]
MKKSFFLAAVVLVMFMVPTAKATNFCLDGLTSGSTVLAPDNDSVFDPVTGQNAFNVGIADNAVGDAFSTPSAFNLPSTVNGFAGVAIGSTGSQDFIDWTPATDGGNQRYSAIFFQETDNSEMYADAVTPAPVPEPGTAPLLVSGLFFFGAVIFRRKFIEHRLTA